MDNLHEEKKTMDQKLLNAYEGICKLRKKSLQGTLTPFEIGTIENQFIEEEANYETTECANKYLSKYYKAIHKFWTSYKYWHTQKSKGMYNLFSSLRNKDQLQGVKGYSDRECAQVLRTMEESWVSANQIYTQYLIDKVKKEYQR